MKLQSKRATRGSERGSTLVIALILLVIVTLFGISAISYPTRTNVAQGNIQQPAASPLPNNHLNKPNNSGTCDYGGDDLGAELDF